MSGDQAVALVQIERVKPCCYNRPGCRKWGAVRPPPEFVQCCVTVSLMQLDRPLQLEILRNLRETYPARAMINDLPSHDELLANLHYLRELGLIDVIDDATIDNPHAILAPKITAKGLDFLEADGGYSAILNTVRIKLNPDDLCALLAMEVESSDLPVEKKSALNKTIRSLSATALQTFAERAASHAVSKWPELLTMLQSFNIS